MKQAKRSPWSWLGRKLRTQFLTGLVAIIPIGVTIGVLVWVFTAIDGILKPIVEDIFGRPIPGIGFGATVLLIYLIGVIASNILGRRLLRFGESLLLRVPLVRQLYTGIKQILASFRQPGVSNQMQVVLVEFPRKGMRTIGFITNESGDKSGKKLLNIFIPTAPNPTSGFLQIAREEEVIRTNISVEEAFTLVASAGKVSPQEIETRLSERTNNI